MTSAAPRLTTVMPGLAADLVEMLRADRAGGAIVEQLGTVPYMGRCPCGPECRNILTAPLGSPAGYLVTLARRGDPAVWLSFDPPPSAGNLTSVEVLDDSLLSAAARREVNAV
ncbi:hypothetical protein [Actinomadura sp. K4S16]|uniref:hypothetical protein n=1 Tax=Actinomadura sp. K4S16 TaxID=1316147 RepID=UPI0011EC34A6|nr:hypothetical protein [Actinomadura sp. K4S16]